MATTKTAARNAAPRTAQAAHSHKELEAQVAALEGQLTSALAAVAALEARVTACENAPAPVADAGGRDEDLRQQLREFFSTSTNRKVATRMPNI